MTSLKQRLQKKAERAWGLLKEDNSTLLESHKLCFEDGHANTHDLIVEMAEALSIAKKELRNDVMRLTNSNRFGDQGLAATIHYVYTEQEKALTKLEAFVGSGE